MRIEGGTEGKVWVKLRVLQGARRASVPVSLRFKVLEMKDEVVRDSYDDEYQVENVSVELTDN